MTAVLVDIPDMIVKKIGIGKEISYENLMIKTIGKEYISTDLKFTTYSDMSEEHKKEYDKLENINKSNLVNI